MKIITFFILLFLINSCLYHKMTFNEKKKNHVRTHTSFSIFRNIDLNKHKSYAADSVLVSGIWLKNVDSLIYKRQFTSNDIKSIKKKLRKAKDIKKNQYVVTKPKYIDSNGFGLYTLYQYPYKQWKGGIDIPILKLDNKIYVNATLKKYRKPKDSTKAIEEFEEFKKLYSKNFNEKDLKYIEKTYKTGAKIKIMYHRRF